MKVACSIFELIRKSEEAYTALAIRMVRNRMFLSQILNNSKSLSATFINSQILEKKFYQTPIIF